MKKFIKLFLRLGLSASFLSAVADRFGFWSAAHSAWGTWDNFLVYTGTLNPWFGETLVLPLAIIATAAEVIFGVCLFIGFKTEMVAKWSGFLLLIFGLSMTFTIGIKAPLDYSVFTASAAAFSLSLIKEKYMEVDEIITPKKRKLSY